MYETADMLSPSKRKLVNEIISEFRAGLIPETPERNKDSRPATKRTAPSAVKKTEPMKKPVPVIRNKTSEKVRKTVRNSKELAALKVLMQDITKKIMDLSKIPSNYAAIVDLKKKRDEIAKKIAQLEG